MGWREVVGEKARLKWCKGGGTRNVRERGSAKYPNRFLLPPIQSVFTPADWTIARYWIRLRHALHLFQLVPLPIDLLCFRKS